MFSQRWINYFFDLAERASGQSKDPNTRHGAVIVNDRKRIVGIGFNGFPRDLKDDPEILNNRELKQKYMVHAEANAINNSLTSVEGCHIFVTGAPCSACALKIIEREIGHVWWLDDGREDFKVRWADEIELATKMFKSAGVITHIIKNEDRVCNED